MDSMELFRKITTLEIQISSGFLSRTEKKEAQKERRRLQKLYDTIKCGNQSPATPPATEGGTECGDTSREECQKHSHCKTCKSVNGPNS